MRMPISGIYKIKGVGDVLAGRVEQGGVKPMRRQGLHCGNAPHACRTCESWRQRWLEHQGSGQEQHATRRRCDDLQKGHHAWANEGVRCTDPGARHPERDQSGLLAYWLCALRSLSMPHLCAEVEDGQGDGRQEDGGTALIEVKRDGSVLLPTTAASCVRHLQELRGPVPRCIHGRQRCSYAWQGCHLRAQG